MRKEGGGRPGQGNGPLSTRKNRKEPPRLSAYLTPKSRSVSVTGTSHRWTRRNHKPRVTLSDAIVWVAFTLLTAASLLALCMLLSIIWPVTP